MGKFTFEYYRSIFLKLKELDYKFCTIESYLQNENQNNIILNRIDVDIKINRVSSILDIFDELDIKATFFFRLHSPHYNLLDFANFNTVKRVISEGHELGLHTELEDMKNICNEDPEELLRKEISLFESLFKTKIFGTASHGDVTGFNNLDFWQNRTSKMFGLLYEGYDEKLFNCSRYISDSEWTQWKAYDKGKLLEGDRRSPDCHVDEDRPELVYLLTHADTYYHQFFHEN